MDEGRFTERTMALKDKLYAVCRSILPCEADREDALQEAVVKAWINLQSLKSPEYFETWLMRILINECRSALRRIKRWPEPLPDVEAAREEQDEGLQEALDAIDAKYRLVIALHYIDGYRLEEIGRMLRLPKGTVAWRLSQGRKLLRRKLGGETQ